MSKKRKNWKRAAGILMAGMVAVGMLGACGKRVIPSDQDGTGASQASQGALEPEKGAKLQYWVSSGNLKYGKAVADSFQKEYGVEVDVSESGLDVVNKMMLAGPAGNGADVFMAAHDTFSTAKDAGILLALDPSVAEKVKQVVSPTAFKTVEQGGKTWGVPVSIETYALLYNKDLVKGAPATTMEEIAKEAQAYNNPKENKFWYLTVPTDGFPAFPFMSLDGYQPFGPDGTDNDHPGFDAPAFEKGLERIADLKKIIPIPADDLKMETISQLEQNFMDGKTAYYPIGPWLIKTLKEKKVNFGVEPLPTLDGKQMKSFGIVQNAYVSSYSKYPKAAQLFAAYLVSEKGAGLLYSQSYGITARKDISNVEGLKDDKELSVYVEAFKNAVPMPSVKRMSDYWTVVKEVLNPVFDHKITPAEGAKKAQEDFQALVKSE